MKIEHKERIVLYNGHRMPTKAVGFPMPIFNRCVY